MFGCFDVRSFWCLMLGLFGVCCLSVLVFGVRAFCFLVFGRFGFWCLGVLIFGVWAHWTDEMDLEYGDGELCSAK